jgi:hypothetical protein
MEFLETSVIHWAPQELISNLNFRLTAFPFHKFVTRYA